MNLPTFLRSTPPEAMRQTIASIKVVRTNAAAGEDDGKLVHTVKLWDALGALRKLATKRGLLTQKVDLRMTRQQIAEMSDDQLAARTAALAELLREHARPRRGPVRPHPPAVGDKTLDRRGRRRAFTEFLLGAR